MMNCTSTAVPDTVIMRMQRTLGMLRDNRKLLTTVFTRVLPPVPSPPAECGSPMPDNLSMLAEQLETEAIALNCDLLNLVAIL